MIITNLIRSLATRYLRTCSFLCRAGVIAWLATSGAQAQPVQTIPDILPMAHKIYSVSHQDMDWQKRHYRIFVAVPHSPQDRQAPVSTLYILDGNAQFPLAVNAVYDYWAKLSVKQSQATSLPLIVGLGYPEEKAYPLQARERDYTYAAPGERFARGGGAADFYEFVQGAVMPYIKTQHPADPGKQILAGHSFGGLFALYVLLNHQDAFDQYVIGSPSLWWGNGAIVTNATLLPGQDPNSENATAALAEQTTSNGDGPGGRFVTILQGEYEENPEADPDMKPERLARMKQRRSPVNARKLDAWLQQRGLDSDFMLVEKSGHGGVIPAVIHAAVSAALKNREQ
ncbi:hypothetical protein CAP48_13810 [Advenella sp. S44]|uniref:alpha/beta hydrolase n=1 Tax=Advenella sp. S44 TaxID=1982755 RepID=UPI000C2A9650|nr:alpha/beta hydrolase-fold protein [Advenella sp. S44]PJX22029.1 hypothetical protein CAP48_13810 [Advenella sp. S44]